MGEFTGKTVVVTGSSGIGLGAALYFARAGAKVYVCGIDDDHNEAARAAACDLPLAVARIDVAEADQVEGWIKAIGDAEGGIDIVVNAAAVQTYGTTDTTDVAHWNRVIGINLTSCFLTSHFAYPFIKARGGGSIVHVSSVQGHANQNAVVAYATTKGAIHALVRAQAVDAAKDGIRVNAISAGPIKTLAASGIGDFRYIMKWNEYNSPLRRNVTTEDVGKAALFLLSDLGTGTTGENLHVDCGYHVVGMKAVDAPDIEK